MSIALRHAGFALSPTILAATTPAIAQTPGSATGKMLNLGWDDHGHAKLGSLRKPQAWIDELLGVLEAQALHGY
jgi:hypothetical protein